MHAIKGGWVGQTLALAKSNDSGGKKSRIRRSKEERKAMVESFIKKYQKSNNGNFPSLNLTHKEVGGSFYTVREIVREIIQENRVLGPAKLTPEDSFLEQYPLGSISVEPKISLLSSNESHEIIDVVHNHHQGTSEEQVLNSTEQCAEHEHHFFEFDNGEILDQRVEVVKETKELDKLVVTDAVHNYEKDTTSEGPSRSYIGPGPEHLRFDSELIINGSSQAVEENKESNGQTCEEPKFRGSRAVEENEESDGQMSEEPKFGGTLAEEEDGVNELETLEVKTADITTDLMVETFPLRPLSETIYDLDESSNGLRTKGIKLEGENSNYVPDRMDLVEKSFGLINESAEADVPGMFSEKHNGLVDDKAVADDGEPLLETPGCSTAKESIVLNKADHKVKDVNPAGNEPVNASIGTRKNSINCEDISTHGQSVSENATAIKCKPDVQHGGSAEKGSNPTLSRINLESWEGTTEKSSKSDINPLLALFKALVDAFVKFWTA